MKRYFLLETSAVPIAIALLACFRIQFFARNRVAKYTPARFLAMMRSGSYVKIAACWKLPAHVFALGADHLRVFDE